MVMDVRTGKYFNIPPNVLLQYAVESGSYPEPVDVGGRVVTPIDEGARSVLRKMRGK
jgi:hypothetical protein